MSDRLAQFMADIAGQTYPEPVSDVHSRMTRSLLDELIPKLPKDAYVLDVGCGQGVALEKFRAKGIEPYGITLNHDDVMACHTNGFPCVAHMDQNDLKFNDGIFDLVWARHVIEHSIAPLWTLTEFHRVLKPNGLLYIEVPAPDTDSCHESNPNHYSVLGHRAWLYLLSKARFSTEESREWKFTTPVGNDVYWSFMNRKI